jgi:hypothetical protein
VGLALLSDQHGNDVAFRATLADVERLGVEEIVCLGDVAQGGSEPTQTLDRLAALGCETVLGHSDAFLLEVPADPPVLRPLAEWAPVTVANGTVAVEFRQVPCAVEDLRAATRRSDRPYADEWITQWA